jgi:hypothetical protein
MEWWSDHIEQSPALQPIECADTFKAIAKFRRFHASEGASLFRPTALRAARVGVTPL